MTNLNVPLIFSGFMFTAIVLSFWGFLRFRKELQKRKDIKRRIKQSGTSDETSAGRSEAKENQNSGQGQIGQYLTILGKKVVSEESDDYSKIKQKFLKAGLYKPHVPHLFWGAKAFLVCFSVCAFVLLRMFIYKVLPLLPTLMIMGTLPAASFYLPELWLRLKIASRQKSIRRGLPDALDLLVVCVEAGMGIDLAIRRVAKEIALSNKELSEELKVVNLELRAGKSRQDALRNLATRVDIEELKSLVTLLIQTDQFGTSLSQGLRVYSDAFRTARFQKAEEIAAKLPVKLVFPCILFILPSLIVVIMGPALIRLFEVLRTM